VLANLFLHYAFDNWMAREFPGVAFERYVDDAVVHCVSQAQAHQVLTALRERMREVGLELHPDKTRVVYCKDTNRRGSYEHTAFTFLGYTFRGREVRPRTGKRFTGFNPAISSDALKKISRQVRSWRLHRHTEISEADLAAWINQDSKSRITRDRYVRFCESRGLRRPRLLDIALNGRHTHRSSARRRPAPAPARSALPCQVHVRSDRQHLWRCARSRQVTRRRRFRRPQGRSSRQTMNPSSANTYVNVL
jgi:Reverse transcriptase (RNA-dependent DNA polymerase)